MGFGAVMSHWSPRREWAGTFDEQWRATRMPLLPTDYDPRYPNVAHPSLQLAEPIQPGDDIQVLGMSSEPLLFSVPSLPLTVKAHFDTGEHEEIQPPIDTVLLQPEPGLCELCARAAFAIGRGRRILREVVVRSDD
jgi:hypothetical protein